MGNTLTDQGQLDEAIGSCQQAVRIKPNYSEAYNNLGNALLAQGKLDEAVSSYQQVLRIEPDYAEAHSNFLFCLNYNPDADLAAIFAEHRRWGEVHTRISEVSSTYRNTPDSNRPLRIGYVSPDFRTHSVAFFIKPILANHDSEQVETICYAEIPAPDATTERLKALSSGWRSTCGMTDAQIADLVQADGIDILVDLAGHTANNRLLAFARKPAPVQVTYLGYANTTGLKTIDYRLTDAWTDAVEQPVLSTEESIRLPHGLLCYAPPEAAPPVSPLPTQECGYITFGSFNNLPKVNPQVVELWSKILLALPQARLILKTKSLNDAATRERYFALFAQNGVSPERLDLMGRTPSLSEHLALYNRVDIGLDPFPYNGGTTTCEALWMGVPVVTLAGATYAGRLGVSLLSSVGLREWIAETPAAYIELAFQFAGHPGRLCSLRANLRSRMAGSPLCDGKTFTRGLEDAYRAMWRRWCRRISAAEADKR